MKKYFRYLVFAASFAGMGISMPSCPAQQAMQQQIDALQTTNMDYAKKLRTLQTTVTGLSNDMNQVKQLLPQMTNVIQAQKGALDQLDTTVQQMRGKGKPAAKKHK
jgi:septal ring factor EnvC (AmiA/AmiB activator)